MDGGFDAPSSYVVISAGLVMSRPARQRLEGLEAWE
jgi:hypothetical protein